MAICSYCGKEMSDSNGCLSIMVINNEVCKRIPYGSEKRFGLKFDKKMSKNKQCHDCRCLKGQYHHFGCDMEECPICGGQLISCGCWKMKKVRINNNGNISI